MAVPQFQSWQPSLSRIVQRKGDWMACERLGTDGKPAVLPPCYYTVQLRAEFPDWTTVQYHRFLAAALRRIGFDHPVHSGEKDMPEV